MEIAGLGFDYRNVKFCGKTIGVGNRLDRSVPMKTRLILLCLALTFFCFASAGRAMEPDPALHQKARDYCDYIQQWASNGWGELEGFESAGGVCEQMYTDDTLTELERMRGSGDSTIWSGMYLASQALRYMATGDEEARQEVLRMAAYLHVVKDITDTPGYIARYAARDEDFWNQEHVGGDRYFQGEGPYEGYFWVGDTSRDQYTGWWLGLSLAYEAVDDESMRATIRADFKDVIDTLIENNWMIVDNLGIIDGNSAATVLPSLRMSWVLQAASVGADESYWDLWDELFEQFKNFLWIDTFSWFNAYGQYFGFNLNHNTFLPIFRLAPKAEQLEHIWEIWNVNVRQWTEWTHNAWFDSVYLAGCNRLGTCDPEEVEAVADDIYNTLTVFADAPNRAFTGDPPDLPLDPFSVLMNELEDQYPFLRDLFDISLRTRDPHDFEDRCWSDMIWQRTPYHIDCTAQPGNRVGPGVDYLIAYWTAFYYGAVPSDGPYGDDDLIDDDDADDDTASPDDDVDDDAGDDDDDDAASPDDDDDETPLSDSGGSDDDDDDGSCCG